MVFTTMCPIYLYMYVHLFRSSTYGIKWVDDTHALIIFATEELGENLHTWGVWERAVAMLASQFSFTNSFCLLFLQLNKP